MQDSPEQAGALRQGAYEREPVWAADFEGYFACLRWHAGVACSGGGNMEWTGVGRGGKIATGSAFAPPAAGTGCARIARYATAPQTL